MFLQLENQIEAQKIRFDILRNQLGHLYERLGKDPEKDYCLIYKNGNENINAFLIKQVNSQKTLIDLYGNC